MELFIILISILVGTLIILFFLRRWIKQLNTGKPSDELLAFLQLTNQRLDEHGKTINQTLAASAKDLNERLDTSARFIASVQKNIGEMSEIGRGMKELQDFMRSPKLRGSLGEQILKELLSQLMPKQSFYLQHTYKSGAIVDAAIKTGNGIIPIDSKFPMEHFRRLANAQDDKERKQFLGEFERGVKKHIDDIAKKYISADDGTIDYALMYLPSESVYYEVVNDPSLFEYSETKRVLPVSPMTFYAYLRTILMSMEGQKIEQQAKEILASIRGIRRDYTKVEENLGLLTKHLTNAYNQINFLNTNVTSLGQKLASTATLSSETVEEVKKLDVENK